MPSPVVYTRTSTSGSRGDDLPDRTDLDRGLDPGGICDVGRAREEREIDSPTAERLSHPTGLFGGVGGDTRRRSQSPAPHILLDFETARCNSFAGTIPRRVSRETGRWPCGRRARPDRGHAPALDEQQHEQEEHRGEARQNPSAMSGDARLHAPAAGAPKVEYGQRQRGDQRERHAAGRRWIATRSAG